MKWNRIVCAMIAAILMMTASVSMADGDFSLNNTYVAVMHPTASLTTLRAEPADSAESLAEIYNGTFVWVHRQVDHTWAEVHLGSMSCQTIQGYLPVYCLDTAREQLLAESPVLVVAPTAGSNGIALRSGPVAEEYNVLGLLPNQSAITVLAEIPGSWYLVQAGGMMGYVSKGKAGEAAGGAEPSADGLTQKSSAVWMGTAESYETAEWPIAIAEYVGVVNNPNPQDRLHLRMAPDVDAPSLGKYYNGVRFVINGFPSEEWVSVSIGGLEGYMKAEYLAIEDMENVPSAMPVVMVNDPGSTEGVELRQQPSAASAVLDVCLHGAKVILMGFSDEWAHVIVNDQTGFLPLEKLK